MYSETIDNCPGITVETNAPGRIQTLVSSGLNSLKNWYNIRKQRHMDRQAFTNLMHLDDSTLKDIGVTRSDVVWASKLPLSENASQRLNEISLQNRNLPN